MLFKTLGLIVLLSLLFDESKSSDNLVDILRTFELDFLDWICSLFNGSFAYSHVLLMGEEAGISSLESSLVESIQISKAQAIS